MPFDAHQRAQRRFGNDQEVVIDKREYPTFYTATPPVPNVPPVMLPPVAPQRNFSRGVVRGKDVAPGVNYTLICIVAVVCAFAIWQSGVFEPKEPPRIVEWNAPFVPADNRMSQPHTDPGFVPAKRMGER